MRIAIIDKQVGNYLKGEYVKEKGITKLKITSEAVDVNGDFGRKLECEVTYDGQTQESPNKWTLNKRSRNALIDKFGPDTTKWIGNVVPIETSLTEKGRAIYVDEVELAKVQEVLA